MSGSILDYDCREEFSMVGKVGLKTGNKRAIYIIVSEGGGG